MTKANKTTNDLIFFDSIKELSDWENAPRITQDRQVSAPLQFVPEPKNLSANMRPIILF